MAVLLDTTTVTPVGNINSNISPQTLPAPDLVPGALLLVAVFYAQTLASASDTIPAGMVKISGTPTPTTGDTRFGCVYAAVVEDPADFAGGIELKSSSTTSRVPAIAASWTPDEGKVFSLDEITAGAPSWQITSLTEIDYPTVVPGTLNVGIVMTNKAANETLTEHASPDGQIIVQARSTSAASGSVSDSVVSLGDGSGVTFNVAQANGIGFSFAITEVDEGAEPEPLPAVTGHGFPSVQHLLETPGATFAHRGLGGTYPEMTEYGVRMAANLGHGVIEVSCCRTLDGVWIATHDNTPDRVILETTFDGQNYNTLTYDQIKNLNVVVGTTGAPKPLATLEQLVNTLPDDFVFMVDPKSGHNNMSEFLDLVDLLLGPERAFIKMDIVPVDRFQAAKARGYITACYFYSSTPEQTIIDRMPYVDLPGMNWDAGATPWDNLLAYGKPVWGHVVSTQEQYNTCISKGATFVQCTTTAITPVGIESWVDPGPADPIEPIEDAEKYSTDYLERAFLLATVEGASDNMSLGDLRAKSGALYRPRSYYIDQLGLDAGAPLSRDDARRAYFLQELS